MKGKRTFYLSTALLGMGAFLLCRPSVQAQVLYGTLTGNVTDVSGGAIVGASVRVNNRGTALTRDTVTNEAGVYTLQNLPAGTYDLTVSASGFSTYTQAGITLNVNTVQRHNVMLQVGQVAETVNVEASAVTLQTDKADVSVEIPAAIVQDLPLPRYRNFQSLINLVPGATPARYQNANTDSPQRSLATNVNGTSRRDNSTRIDGTLTMQLQLSHAMYLPASETIEVVNVTTDAADAEQGLSGGSSITMTTKSGTNEFHGSAFGYHMDNAFIAKDFFFKGARTPKNIINIDGATMGGPIKKDKFFFFAGYESTRERTNYNLLYTLPTEDQRRGDFSKYPNTVLYDPATGDSQGRNRTPFPNNIVPPNRLNPISLKLQSLVPATNEPGLINNFFNSGTDVTNRDQVDAKVNYNRNANHTFFLKYGVFNAAIRGVGGLGAAQGQCLCTGGATGDGAGRTLVQTSTFGQTKTFSPTFIYDMTIGWSREAQTVDQTYRGVNYGLDILGIPGTNGPQINDSGMPRFDISNGYSSLGNYDNWMPAERHEMVYTMTHNFSYQKGSHSIRWGFEGIHNRLNHFQPGPATQGNASFTDGATRLNGGPGGNQFNSWASYLLGAVQTWTKGVQWEEAYAIDWQFGLYVRDRWQVTPKLTVSYGLRWEKYPMMHRAGAHHTGIENYDPATNLVYLGGNGNNPSGLGITTSNRLFTPRVGIAYRVRNDLVIRTGYGINIDPQPFLGWNRSQWPAAITGTFTGPNTFVPFDSFEQGIPPIFGPPAGSPTAVADPKASITYFPKTVVRTYFQSWNFSVEGRLPHDTILSVGYVGTESTHLRGTLQENAASPGTGQNGQPLFAPFQRTASTSFSDGMFSGNYHSLQVALNKRAANGLTLKGAYTWSHSLGFYGTSDTGGGVVFPLPGMGRRNYTNSPFDVRQNLELGYIYELPFGKGKKYAVSGVASRLAGGWQVNGIFAAYTGRPFNVTSSSTACNCPLAFSTFTADQVKPEVRKTGAVEQWFDKTAFAPVNRRTGTLADFGNMNTYQLYAPGLINLDTSLFREFSLTERFKLQFRSEFFNLTNTPHFNAPDGNASSPTFMVINSSFGSRFAQDATNRIIRFALRLHW
jgi:hypothetical protein